MAPADASHTAEGVEIVTPRGTPTPFRTRAQLPSLKHLLYVSSPPPPSPSLAGTLYADEYWSTFSRALWTMFQARVGRVREGQEGRGRRRRIGDTRRSTPHLPQVFTQESWSEVAPPPPPIHAFCSHLLVTLPFTPSIHRWWRALLSSIRRGPAPSSRSSSSRGHTPRDAHHATFVLAHRRLAAHRPAFTRPRTATSLS